MRARPVSPRIHLMNKPLCVLLLMLAGTSFLRAGEQQPPVVSTAQGAPQAVSTNQEGSQFIPTSRVQAETDFVPLDFVDTETAYNFGSDINRGGVNFGSQDALQNAIEYGHRFQLSGNFYFHAGLAYQRFDFAQLNAPLPVHLQSGAGVIGIDYMRGADVGAFIQFRPGFYTEEHLGLRSFDCPITAARFFVVREDKFYILVGATYSFLRSDYPVLPLVGFVWRPCPQWQIQAVPPEPKIIYSPNKKLNLWVGGEFTGGSFRTDNKPKDFEFNSRLSGAELDYIDYRAGAGLAYAPSQNVSVDLSAGYSLQRQFDFERADQTYRSDPAPYLRFGIHARF